MLKKGEEEMLTISYVSFSFFEGVRGTETGVGPSLEKGRGQEKAVSHPARSLTPTPTVPRRPGRSGGRSFVSRFGGQGAQKQPGPGEALSLPQAPA